MFQGAGVTVIFLSADDRVNRAVADSRRIDFWYTRDKENDLQAVCDEYNVSVEDICFIGDDVHDESMMGAIIRGGGEAYCPSDAWPSLLRSDQIVTLNAEGGHGVVMALYDRRCG